MKTRCCLHISVISFVVGLALSPAVATDLVLTAPGYDHTNAYALDHPELNAVLTDNGSVITEDGEPVIIEVFLDTGASGLVISYLNAEGYDYEPIVGWGWERVPSLGLDGDPAGEFIGTFTETGVGGPEVGNVTRNFGVKVLNGPMGGSSDPADFVDYGQHSLWVRQAAGPGEIAETEMLVMVDPINIAGMPVISQRVMVMDPTPLVELGRMETHLLPQGAPGIPETNVTFDLYLANLTGAAPPGEVLPSYSDNPLIPNVTIKHTGNGNTTSIAGNNWLVDTLSGSTFISFAKAQTLGLIDPSYADLEEYLPNHIAAGGLVGEVGGIGGTKTAPILRLDEIRIPDKQGNFDVVWQNIDIMVIDIPVPAPGGGEIPLDGVMGLNLLVPAVTVDPDDPLSAFDDISPGYFDAIVFDATDGDNVELRLYCELVDALAMLGDLNGDGLINAQDINPFILAMTDLAAWQATYPSLDILTVGDCDDDGLFNAQDINPFVAIMTSGMTGGGPVPEPCTLGLFAVGALLLLRRRRKA